MNGRIERAPALELELAVYSELNYANVDFFFRLERKKQIRRKLRNVCLFIFWVGYCWLITYGTVKGW